MEPKKIAFFLKKEKNMFMFFKGTRVLGTGSSRLWSSANQATQEMQFGPEVWRGGKGWQAQEKSEERDAVQEDSDTACKQTWEGGAENERG